MRKLLKLNLIAVIVLILLVSACNQSAIKTGKKTDMSNEIIKKMVEKFGENYKSQIIVGVNQVNKLWVEKDGSMADMEKFCIENFIINESEKEICFNKITYNFEQMSGLLVEMNRTMTWGMEIDDGPISSIDPLFSKFSLSPFVGSTLFDTQIAFWVLLNYRIYSTEECLEQGFDWSSKKWAEVRLAQRFQSRIPSSVAEENHAVRVDADNYISNYNIYMHNILDENNNRLFPKDLCLITHWGLRDELKSQFQEKDGLKKQKIIYDVMKKIITQEIPKAVINNPDVDWKISENTVSGETTDNAPEANIRYEKLRNIFLAEQKADPYSFLDSTYIQRKFNSERRLTEDRVRDLFINLLESDEFKQTALFIKERLGRDLQPFDIWYNGFKTQKEFTDAKLSAITKKKYPNADVFKEKMPDLLKSLGFSNIKAKFLQQHIEVDPSRGAGHAMGAGRRQDNAHLRTRVGKTGMDYKGYNIATHELGHNVEQTYSIHGVENTLIKGVPNTAFTEAFAFYFQERDLKLLGLENVSDETEHLKSLHRLWSTCEIGAVSLVEMELWHWMYDNPNFTPQELKESTIKISKEIWNNYFAEIFGTNDEMILGIYSHMIEIGLYLPDYPLGHIIQAQYEEYGKGKNFAQEMERMCSVGSIAPDVWMTKAVGTKVSSAPLRRSAKEALEFFGRVPYHKEKESE